jgi:biopolymer transport protein ExbD
MKRNKKPKEQNTDLDLLPIMNLFSILIPFLLSMAVFQKLAVVEVNMPAQSMSQEQTEEQPDLQALNLTVAITNGYFEIWAMGGSLPKMYVKEFRDYQCRTDSEPHRHDPAASPEVRCKDGSVATVFDIQNIHVFSIQKQTEEDAGSLVRAVLNANDSAYLDANGQFLTSKAQLQINGVYRTLDKENTVRIDAAKFNDAREEYRSGYDDLAVLLMDIHSRFVDMIDADNIIILADDAVVFDKVISTMDVAREAGFTNIQLAKLQGG